MQTLWENLDGPDLSALLLKRALHHSTKQKKKHSSSFLLWDRVQFLQVYFTVVAVVWSLRSCVELSSTYARVCWVQIDKGTRWFHSALAQSQVIATHNLEKKHTGWTMQLKIKCLVGGLTFFDQGLYLKKPLCAVFLQHVRQTSCNCQFPGWSSCLVHFRVK